MTQPHLQAPHEWHVQVDQQHIKRVTTAPRFYYKSLSHKTIESS
jgi:hypothetical protein